MNRLLKYFTRTSDSEQKPGALLRLLTAPGQDLTTEDLQPAQPPKEVTFHEDNFWWGFRRVPIKEAAKGLLLCGCVGSGKTTIIDLFLRSIAPRFLPGRARPEQLIISDVKTENLPLLAASGLRPHCKNFWLLNPFDKRGAILSISEMVKIPAMIRYFGGLIIPREPNSTAPYFPDAARELVFAVILALNVIKGSSWSFRDLL